MARKIGIKKLNAGRLAEALMVHYEAGARYLVPNVYFFDKAYGETDLLVVKEGKKKMIYDIEIKISRADYKADFKKVAKHEILEKATMTFPRRKSIKLPTGKRRMIPANTPFPVPNRPNRFYYAVPKDLISVDEVPNYAGLIYVHDNGRVEKVKEAKLLHNKEVAHEAVLCRKFYFYWKNMAAKHKQMLKTCK